METMNTFLNLIMIPDTITLYTIVFYGSLLLPLFVVFLSKSFYTQGEKNILQYFGFIYVFCVFILIAYRPIGLSGFTDTEMYIIWFNDSKVNNVIQTKDIGFGILIYLTSKMFTVRYFFVMCTLLSFGLLFFISKKIAGQNWFLFFLGFMISLYFWNHQVFTIRQGIASLLFLLGLLQRKTIRTIIFLVIAISFHKSFLLPFVTYFIVTYCKKTNLYILFWLISIPISYFFGKDIGNMILIHLPPDISYYFPQTADSTIPKNFRWDVVLYSSIFVLLAYFYKCKSDRYVKIFNLFLITNTFVILLIWPAGGYIHRFAYLSWFLTPIIVYYPLFLNKKMLNFERYFKTIVLFYLLVLMYIGFKLFKQDFKFVEDQKFSISNNYNKVNIFKEE